MAPMQREANLERWERTRQQHQQHQQHQQDEVGQQHASGSQPRAAAAMEAELAGAAAAASAASEPAAAAAAGRGEGLAGSAAAAPAALVSTPLAAGGGAGGGHAASGNGTEMHDPFAEAFVCALAACSDAQLEETCSVMQAGAYKGLAVVAAGALRKLLLSVLPPDAAPRLKAPLERANGFAAKAAATVGDVRVEHVSSRASSYNKVPHLVLPGSCSWEAPLPGSEVRRLVTPVGRGLAAAAAAAAAAAGAIAAPGSSAATGGVIGARAASAERASGGGSGADGPSARAHNGGAWKARVARALGSLGPRMRAITASAQEASERAAAAGSTVAAVGIMADAAAEFCAQLDLLHGAAATIEAELTQQVWLKQRDASTAAAAATAVVAMVHMAAPADVRAAPGGSSVGTPAPVAAAPVAAAVAARAEFAAMRDPFDEAFVRALAACSDAELEALCSVKLSGPSKGQAVMPSGALRKVLLAALPPDGAPELAGPLGIFHGFAAKAAAAVGDAEAIMTASKASSWGYVPHLLLAGSWPAQLPGSEVRKLLTPVGRRPSAALLAVAAAAAAAGTGGGKAATPAPETAGGSESPPPKRQRQRQADDAQQQQQQQHQRQQDGEQTGPAEQWVDEARRLEAELAEALRDGRQAQGCGRSSDGGGR